MKRSEAFPSKYLSKDDVVMPIVATIRAVHPEMLKGDDGDERKVVMEFEGDVKPLIINNTNWMTLEDAYGEDSDAWLGKMVELYKEPAVMFAGKRVGGVRVRIPAGNGNGHAPKEDPILAAKKAWMTDQSKPNFLSLVAALAASPEDVRRAFGEAGVQAWMKAEGGRTAEQAAQALADAMLF